MDKRFWLLLIFSVVWLTAVARAQTAEDSLQAAMREINDRLDGIGENIGILNSDVAILKYLKVSGYVQARYEYNDSSQSGVVGGYDASKNPNANNFYIRRGRVKFTFQPGTSSKYVIYFDASKSDITLKEAYVELYKLIGLHQLTLTFGQFNWPFGYEIELSSSVRDFPERSLGERTLFKGERDRGTNLTWTLPRFLQFNVGMFQGYGIEDKTFTWFDPTKPKDFIARAKAKLGLVDVGVSGYWGQTYTPGSAAVPAKPGETKWYDANHNGAIDPGETTTTDPVAAKPAVAAVKRDKIRYGIDAQIYLDILPLGGTSVRVEGYYSESYSATATDLSAVGTGFYVWISQSIFSHFGAGARYDFFDPNVHNDYVSPGANLLNDAVGNLSLAVHYFWDANVRITAAYDFTRQLEDGSLISKYAGDRKDNRFTLQFQFSI